MNQHLFDLSALLALALLAWDALRRFAQSPSREDLDDNQAHLEGLSAEFKGRMDQMDMRLDNLDIRTASHGQTLTKLGLSKLGGPKT